MQGVECLLDLLLLIVSAVCFGLLVRVLNWHQMLGGFFRHIHKAKAPCHNVTGGFFSLPGSFQTGSVHHFRG